MVTFLKFTAIDIGSNAIRLLLAVVSENRPSMFVDVDGGSKEITIYSKGEVINHLGDMDNRESNNQNGIFDR